MCGIGDGSLGLLSELVTYTVSNGRESSTIWASRALIQALITCRERNLQSKKMIKSLRGAKVNIYLLFHNKKVLYKKKKRSNGLNKMG